MGIGLVARFVSPHWVSNRAAWVCPVKGVTLLEREVLVDENEELGERGKKRPKYKMLDIIDLVGSLFLWEAARVYEGFGKEYSGQAAESGEFRREWVKVISQVNIEPSLEESFEKADFIVGDSTDVTSMLSNPETPNDGDAGLARKNEEEYRVSSALAFTPDRSVDVVSKLGLPL